MKLALILIALALVVGAVVLIPVYNREQEHNRHESCLALMNSQSEVAESLGKNPKTLKQEDDELRSEGCAPEVKDLAKYETAK